MGEAKEERVLLSRYGRIEKMIVKKEEAEASKVSAFDSYHRQQAQDSIESQLTSFALSSALLAVSSFSTF
jgi:hypothetical protein